MRDLRCSVWVGNVPFVGAGVRVGQSRTVRSDFIWSRTPALAWFLYTAHPPYQNRVIPSVKPENLSKTFKIDSSINSSSGNLLLICYSGEPRIGLVVIGYSRATAMHVHQLYRRCVDVSVQVQILSTASHSLLV